MLLQPQAQAYMTWCDTISVRFVRLVDKRPNYCVQYIDGSQHMCVDADCRIECGLITVERASEQPLRFRYACVLCCTASFVPIEFLLGGPGSDAVCDSAGDSDLGPLSDSVEDKNNNKSA